MVLVAGLPVFLGGLLFSAETCAGAVLALVAVGADLAGFLAATLGADLVAVLSVG